MNAGAVRRRAGAWPVSQKAGGASRRETPVRGAYKRAFDLTVLGCAGVALAPVWALLCAAIACAIRLEDGGPVLYRQRRLGHGGVPFAMWKFRTMAVDAEAATGPVWAAPHEPRATRTGAVLRRLHLDELPQAVNVLLGQMSLVGPRPERPALAARIGRVTPEFDGRLRVRPGIAGLAQARAPYHCPPRRKLRYDTLYIERMSPWLDAKLLLACAGKVLRPAARRA